MLFFQTLVEENLKAKKKEKEKEKLEVSKKDKKSKDKQRGKFNRKSKGQIEIRMFEKHAKYAKYRRNGFISLVLFSIFYGISYSLSTLSSQYHNSYFQNMETFIIALQVIMVLAIILLLFTQFVMFLMIHNGINALQIIGEEYSENGNKKTYVLHIILLLFISNP